MDQMIPVTHVQPHVPWSGTASLITPEPWVQDALCAQVDADLFFPEKGYSPEPARRVCLACPVMDDCLAFALRTGQTTGVWAGKTGKQLRRMREREAA